MATQLITRNHFAIIPSLAFTILLCLHAFTLRAQIPQMRFDTTFMAARLDSLQQAFGQQKHIPTRFQKQILLALSFFPELKTTPIEFIIKKAHTPLSTRPAYTSIFKSPGERSYLVIISDSSISTLSPILFDRLPFNAQVGVIGHELSHIVYFSSKNTFRLLYTGIMHVSSKFLDRFEYRTDSSCISHGLGFQLLSWSLFVRKALHIKEWHGAQDPLPGKPSRERYMNPETIVEHMREDGLYDSFYFIRQAF